jgi:outer membrane immunogenic protein
MLGSLRGKVGFVPAPNWLIYGTGGAALAHVTNTLTDTSSFAELYSGNGKVVQESGILSNTASGGTSMSAGQPAPASIGSSRLHYGFPEHSITLTNNAGGSFALTAKENVDTVKGRISYLFGIH